MKRGKHQHDRAEHEIKIKIYLSLSEDYLVFTDKELRKGGMEMGIVKPRTDTREYRRIVLPNSLEALLISDPEADKVFLTH